jgi:hypothetical protein
MVESTNRLGITAETWWDMSSRGSSGRPASSCTLQPGRVGRRSMLRPKSRCQGTQKKYQKMICGDVTNPCFSGDLKTLMLIIVHLHMVHIQNSLALWCEKGVGGFPATSRPLVEVIREGFFCVRPSTLMKSSGQTLTWKKIFCTPGSLRKGERTQAWSALKCTTCGIWTCWNLSYTQNIVLVHAPSM